MPTVAIANATMEHNDSSSVRNRGRACARVSTSSINLTSAKGREGSMAFNCSCTTDRKSTRLNSSHTVISYAVFCLKKKKKKKKKKNNIHKTYTHITYSTS